MKIKEPVKEEFILLGYLKRYKVLGGLLVLIFYSGLLISFGGILHKEGFFGEILMPAIKENIRIPFNYIRGIRTSPEHITIDIKHIDYQKLAYKREIALEKGVLHVSQEDFVPAKIRWNGKTVNVKLRLKGDLADHWARDYKWSLRIKAEGDETIMGMKSFSIQHPRTRGFMNDWVLHRLLESFGFITLRYNFIEATINGKNLGIYAMEEHFEKRLIENNNHINGHIIRIKDHLLWYLVDPRTGFSKDQLDELYSSSPIDAFTTNTINKDETLLNNFNNAKDLLESFRRGKLSTHKVFDIDKLAMIFAVIDLFGYRHTTAYSNIRFYYNPITSRLVPIGYDNTFINEADSIEGQAKQIQMTTLGAPQRLDWKKTFFKDKIFFEKYIEALQLISDKKFLDDFFSKTDSEFRKQMYILYKNFPGYSFEKEKSLLYENQVFIKKILNPVEGIQAYLYKFDEKRKALTLELGNIQSLPVEVLSASYNGHVLPLVDSKTILQAKTPFQTIDFQKVKFKLPEEFSWTDDMASSLKVNYKILGTKNTKNISVLPWPYLSEDFLETDFIRQKPNYKKFDFLIVDNKNKTILIKKGSWNLNTNLIIATGFTVVSTGGTQVNLLNSAKILSYSPFKFIGSEENPIIIKSTDSTGQGIVILNSNKRSILRNVIFKNLSAPTQGRWQVPAAVTFYESPVDIWKCEFIGNRAGAALSIIRSEFTIEQSNFKQTFSDALNIVFGKGSITKASFVDIGRDGISLSGSVVNAKDIYIKKVSEKGINVGEKSQVDIKNIEIKFAKTAIESRDLSKVTIENVDVAESDTCFAVLQNKTEFGPAAITVKSLEQKAVNNAHVVGEGSSLIIDGKKIEATEKPVVR